ncbi:MAG: ATPase domain-containing protein [Candidatus Aminicenantales bacterium]
MNKFKRISTGVPGLDEVLKGGLIPSRSYLLVGETGTGKTILSLQWLFYGFRKKEKCLFISLAEPRCEIELNVSSFGWNLDEIDFTDLSPPAQPREIGEYRVFTPSEVEQEPMWEAIYKAIEKKRPQRIVIDSISQLQYLSADEFQFRKRILALLKLLNRKGCTSFLTCEPSGMEETSLIMVANGVIRLRNEVSTGRDIGIRSLEVRKFRGSDFISGYHPMRITSKGIHIFPHRIETPEKIIPAQRLIASGIAPLDELLEGGIESGTATIITGPTGVGKTSLGMKFVTQAIKEGEKAAVYTFEESVESILMRCQNIGIKTGRMVTSRALQMVLVNPMELYPDEFLCLIREAVEENGCRIVMVDGVRGYNLAMEQFGSLVAHMKNLVTYLQSKGVTLFLVNGVEHITGPFVLTEMGISYIADNILLLRYAEHAGQVIRVVACVKKRLGDFQPELRELMITSRGIQVGEKLSYLQGLLTGTPRSMIKE